MGPEPKEPTSHCLINSSLDLLLRLDQPALMLLDSSGRVLTANQGASQLTGFSPAEILGLDFLSLFQPQDRENITRCLRQGSPPGSTQADLITARGKKVPVGICCSSGSSQTWVALWDQEELKRLHRLAQEAADRAEKIAGMGDIGILIYDQDFRIEFANEMAGEILGLPSRSLLGMEITRFLGRIHRIQLKDLHSPLHPDGPRRVRMEMPLERPDNTKKLVEICLSMIRTPLGQSHTYAYLRDLTERVQMEMELRKTNEFLQNVIRSSVDGIIAADMKGNIIIFNEGAERLLGYRAEEVIGKIHITQLYPPGVAKKIMRRLRSDTYGPRGKLPTTPTTIVAKTGEHIPVRISAAIVYEGEREIASVGIFRDLRERIKMQQQLEDTYRQLLHSEKLASLGKLAAGVAHELNNPLGGILMYANMLLEQAADGPMAQDLKVIVEQALRCKEIVRGLLDFARRRGEERVRVDLNKDVIEKCIAIMSKQAMFLNIQLECELPSDLPPIAADPDQLSQVFTNLIVNAVDAMEGKGTLRIRTWAEGSPAQLHAEVSDTGSGIPEDYLPRIFDPFFTTKEVGKGTGLGLSIAYGIVRRLGGDIQVRSRAGEGTTFHLRFPLEPASEIPAEVEEGVAGIRDQDGRFIQVVLAGERTLTRLLSFYDAFQPKGAFEGLPPAAKRERRKWVIGLMGGWRNFLLLDGDQVVGHVGVTLGESDLEEVIIFLRHEYRGKGIGSRALRHVGSLLAREGCRRLWLTVESTNTVAIRCFQKAGFRFTSRAIEPEMEMVMDLGEWGHGET
ncbi:MAG: GNAT family N-acetyltransferase [bacterium]